MLGIISMGLIMTAAVGRTIRDTIQNSQNKKKYGDGISYIDNKGKTRLSSNDHTAHIFSGYTAKSIIPELKDSDVDDNDRVLVDLDTMKPIKNLTIDDRVRRRNDFIQRSIETSKRLGRSVYNKDFDEHKKDAIKGIRYYDMLDPSKVYVIKSLVYGCGYKRKFYFDINNNKFIRRTDSEIESDDSFPANMNPLYFYNGKVKDYNEEIKLMNALWNKEVSFDDFENLYRFKNEI